MTRALFYALTSLFAHASGYFLQASSRTFSDALLIFALWATSIPFFFDYANSYHTEDPLGRGEEEVERWANSQSRVVTLIITVSAIISVLAIYFGWERKMPGPAYWAAFGIFSAVFYSYGRYIVRKSGPPVMRHQLVWPVIFSIALPLYSGIVFTADNGKISIAMPVLFLLMFFTVSLALRRIWFVTSGLSSLALVIAARILGLDGNLAHLSIMAFYLCIAAYLAVFEAWGITASLTLKEHINIRESDTSESPHLPQSTRYYLASFAALSVAALSLPMLYIFSDYGRIFFWGTLIHFVAAFLVWFWAGGDLRRLRVYRNRWLTGKTIAGFLFLGVLVGDAFLQLYPIKRSLSNLVVPGTMAWTFTVMVLAAGYRYRQDKESDFTDWLKRLHTSRTGLLFLTVLLSFLMGAGTLVIEGFQDMDNIIMFKSDRVFICYVVAVLVGSALLLLRGGVRNSMNTLLGLTLSARLFTSTIIGLAVFLPALRSSIPVLGAILNALPFFLASAGGFLLNDACDYERDVISKPFRPIPRGLIGPRTAWGVGLALVVLAVGITFWGSGSFIGWAMQMAAIIGVVAYNTVTAKAGWVKAPFAALLCMLPLIFVVNAYGYPSGYWWVIVGGYTFSVGRELLMDVLDMKGDKATGLKTLPIKFGARRSEIVALLCVSLSFVALLLFRNVSEVPVHRAEVDLALIGLIALGAAWWKIRTPQHKRQIVRLGWIPMLLMLAAFL
jgi:geranylgeranylglycerol-phosphate geranylgeranyltransferase